MAKNFLQSAKSNIEDFFDANSIKIFKYRELSDILKENGQSWKLKYNQSFNGFIEFLVNNSKLSVVPLDFPHRKETRYIWGNFTIYSLLMNISPTSYFSHHTAVLFNNLTEQVPKNIYVNTEQSKKSRAGGKEMLQTNIDLAFQNKQRISNNFAYFEQFTIYHISGKKSENLGVIEIDHVNYGIIKVTNIERTLIDITVRPVYSGGVFEVLKAYKLAKEYVSVNKLLAYLKELDYTYPYHQLIGFYLERAGYKENQIKMVEETERKYNFYLDYKITDKEFDSKWKVYYPKGL